MRYVSEQFKELQSEIIRPALSNLLFEVGTDVANTFTSLISDLNFDTSVAPVVKPKDTTNVYNYAVLGDKRNVDDPTRICAPYKEGVLFPTPNHSVPYGITAYTPANTDCVIGDSTYYFNFTDIKSPITFSFIGGHKPNRIKVEYYDPEFGIWQLERTEFKVVGYFDEYTFTPDNYDNAEDKYRRLKVANSYSAGRFQLSWARADRSVRNGAEAVSFNKTLVQSAKITESTDLTSQSLPSYEMTVECLDVNGEYTPDTEYWNKQFKDGSPCYLKASYRINGVDEFIPVMYGTLTEKPSYQQGKITFKVAVDWRKEWVYNLAPVFDENLSVGDEVPGNGFYEILLNSHLFDSYDVFGSYDDRTNSVCNYSGEVDSKDARQLIANALGCHITADFNKVELKNSNSIQYRGFDDYLTRYDQVKYSLESKPKVGKISVARNANTVSADYVEATASASGSVGTDSMRYAIFFYEVPFFATGKWELLDAQSTDPDAVISLFANPDVEKLDNGNFLVAMPFASDIPTTIQPIVRFYKVDNAQFDETETLTDSVEGEVYTNDNKLVANTYIANKVKQVAHLVSDISNQYEVDVIQDLRYEVGDIIRLETEKNTYVTCVITGISFNLPGSNGHITCRKVFSFEDSDEAVFEPIGLAVSFGLTSIEVTGASERAAYIGVTNTPTTRYIYVLGVEAFEQDISGTVTQESYNATLTDLNNHVWKFAYFTIPSGVAINTGAPIIDLPDYDYTKGASEGAFGAISLLKAIYQDQGMTAPVDYACAWDEL